MEEEEDFFPTSDPSLHRTSLLLIIMGKRGDGEEKGEEERSHRVTE